ncbi:MAG: hypothetical protein IT210_11075 [Armatimonadetes bacterium]|nr:hypothetical protein [Armatimonadota bacterium]
MKAFWVRTAGLGLTIGVLVSLMVGQSQGDVRTATYKGSKMCIACHKGIHKDIVNAYNMTAHSKALLEASAEGAIVADFANAPIKKDQVAWVLGIGKREQAYIDKDWKTLPAKWSVAEKKWTDLPVENAKEKCVACHTTGFNTADMSWVETGVGCESCHGPGSEHISAPAASKKTTIVTLSSLPKDRQMMVCGKCHSKGTDPSKKFPFPVLWDKDASGNLSNPKDFRPGDDLNQAFIHDKPTQEGQNQQFSELLMGKHFAAGNTCTTCHEPHKDTGQAHQLKKAEVELCLDCHKDTIKDIKTHQPTASDNAKCSDCHMPGTVRKMHTFMSKKSS